MLLNLVKPAPGPIIEPVQSIVQPQPVQIVQPIKVVQPVVQSATILEVVNKPTQKKPPKTTRTKCCTCKNCLKIAAIMAAVFFALSAIAGVLMTVLLVYQRHFFYPLPVYTTTTKVSGSITLNVGQLCQWNSQCPVNAHCLGTCHCSDDTYFVSSSGICEIAGDIGAACTANYMCNKIKLLTCIGGSCACDPLTHVWDDTFVGGGGLLIGRCILLKGQGQPDACTNTAGSCCSSLFTKATNYGSPSPICTCPGNSFLNFETGACENVGNMKMLSRHCDSSLQCPMTWTACMNVDGDPHHKCTPLPTHYFINDVYAIKGQVIGAACNVYQPCDEWLNLRCNFMYGNGSIGLSPGQCVCLDKYYYWNGTMCVLGARYGEACSIATPNMCVPQGSMTCALPYSSAGYTVCKCSATQFFNAYTESCQTLKTYGATCRDNSECRDAYAASASPVNANSGYCGRVAGASQTVCRCSYNFFAFNSGGALNCIAKLSAGTACNAPTSTTPKLTWPQCQNNMACLPCANANGCCACDYISYLTTNATCLYTGYFGDRCQTAVSGNACWPPLTCNAVTNTCN